MRTIQLDRLKQVARQLPIPLQLPLRRLARYLRNRQYACWVQEFDNLSQHDLDAIRAHIASLTFQPLVSVVMPCYNPPEWALAEAIESVRNQVYQNWELCIADDASPSEHVVKVLIKSGAKDSRIKWVGRERNGGISAASNSALELAQGEYVALMDHDDILPPNALYEVALALNENSSLDIIYSDEDQIDGCGRRHSPYFKTDWNIDLLRGHNMVSHLGVYRRSLIEKVGAFKEGLEGSQDYDLALRCADATAPHRIHHIPSILYHWRRDYGVVAFSEENASVCREAAISALQDHLARCEEVGK